MNLRMVLLLRGAFGLLFTLYLLFVPISAEAQRGLGRNGYYAVIDGLIGFALWFALSRHPTARWLSSLALADAVVRFVIGVFGLVNPGIQSRVLGSVAYYGVIVVACVALGAVGMIYVATMAKRALPNGRRSGALPAFVVSLCTLLFGLALVFGLSTEDSRRTLVLALAAVLGLTYLVSGIRLKR